MLQSRSSAKRITHPVASRQRILENSDLGRYESEQNKEQSYTAKREKREVFFGKKGISLDRKVNGEYNYRY